MKQLVTVFKNIRDTKLPMFVSCLDVLERIRNGKSKTLIEKIRPLEDKTDRDKLKMGLPSICFSGQFKTRADNEITEHSGLICLDFDGYETKELMDQARLEFVEDEYSFSVFVSPSGKGLKILVKIPREITNHTSYFSALRDYYDSPNWDPTSVNISRVCYESYDPDIYINKDSTEWSKLGAKEYKEVVRGVDRTTVPITDENRIVEILVQWWKREFPMNKGGRNQNAYVLAAAFNDYGIDESTALSVLSGYEQRGKDAFTMSEIKTTVKSAYTQSQNFNTKYYEDTDKLNSLRSDLNNGASKKDIQMQLTGMNIGSEMVGNIVSKLDKEVSGKKFWTKSDKGIVKIIPISLKRFLEGHGYFKYNPEGSTNYVFVKVTNNLIDHTTDKEIKTFVLEYLLKINDDSIYNYFAENTKFFKEDFLTFLGSVKVHFIDDGKDFSHLYFKNSAVKITPKGITMIDYIDLGGYVWKDHVIDRNFELNKDKKCEFKQFLSNVSSGDEDRLATMESTIGFLLHGHKPPSYCPSVILNDEIISDNPEGGTGKGLVMKGVSQLKKMVVIDGKSFDFRKSFPYQLVSADTQILLFDDVKKGFNFVNLFSVITEGITLEKKNKDAIKLPFSKSPKIAITTNYAVKGSGGSNDRRKWELELHQHYTLEHTPFHDFGHYMFDEWDKVEWSRFDNYMIRCLIRYLAKGLVKSEFVNLKIRKLSVETCHEFIEWVGVIENSSLSPKVERFVGGGQTMKIELYTDFTLEYPDYAAKSKMTVSRNMFYKWLIAFCIFKGQVAPKEGRNANGRWIQLINKHEYEENLTLDI